MMDIKNFTLELKNPDESGTFEGRLAVYNNIDAGGDVIERGAFAKTSRKAPALFPCSGSMTTRHRSALCS